MRTAADIASDSVRLTWMPRGEQTPIRAEPIQATGEQAGVARIEMYRLNDRYLVRIPEIADFEMDCDGREVVARPAPGASDALCQHLFLNQVRPLALSRRGRLVFHGAAVASDAGALAFLGAAGRGKSTLAASFATTHVPFMTDDALLLSECRGVWTVVPDQAAIRLWPDSRDAVAASQTLLASYPGATKLRAHASPALPHCDEPRRLRAVYCLGDGAAHSTTIERMDAREALMAWLAHAFLLDVEDGALVRAHFERVVRLANDIACFRLDFPRRYDALADVRRAILTHAQPMADVA